MPLAHIRFKHPSLAALSLALGLSACAAPPPASVSEEGSALIAGSGSGQYLAARHATYLHDTKTAADAYDQALAKDPNNVELLTRASVLKTAEEQPLRAQVLAERLLSLDPEAAPAVYILTVRDTKNGDFSKAARRLSTQPRRGLNSFVVPLLEAWANFGDKNIEKALEVLTPLKESSALMPLYGFHAGLINELAGRPEAAARLYESTLASPAGLTLRAVRVVGAFHLARGEKDKAQALFERYRTDNPDSSMLDPEAEAEAITKGIKPISTAAEGMAEALFGAAASLKQAGAADTALMLCRLAQELQPDFPLLKVLIGGILEDMNRLEEADAVYASIPASEPAAWPVRIRLAENLNRLKKVDEAETLLEQLATERPQRFDPLISLGDIRRQAKRFDQAADAYSRALSRMGKLEKRHWPILYARGIAFERSKQWPKAEADFKQALALEPDQPYVLNYLGYSWVEQGVNLVAARKMIEKAVDLRPTDGYIADSLGWVLYRLNDLKGAVRFMERAAELQPEDPVINDHLGDVYWTVGRKNEARFQWKKSLVFDPEPELAQAIKIKLERGLTNHKK
ncbi:MAG: tetratricopeptide repeat protein [Alphaproteobacteria bacterium]|nr:tetratricopeptide repeat protein [Alphaproteobacteria bacterium]